ncbi:MAG: hypothetical protein M3N97_03225 [Pseudomonadota bacterium]|nr:hypothetical protein [Pseudomonadota bacterium]
MNEANTWGRSRYIVLFVVLMLHVALLALLVVALRTRNVLASSEGPIEVMFLPPTKVAKVRADNTRPQRVSTDIAIALEPPSLNSSLQSGPGSAPDGRGPAVNWAAEAHRAVRAFEIRRDRPPNSAMSVSPSWDDWWPREHQAGDQFKTDSGDWIVWIDANCYQVAGWRSNLPAFGATAPRTVCRVPGDTRTRAR